MTKYTPEQRITKFWEKVDKSGGADACWNWTAYCRPKSYGLVGYRNKVLHAHRVSWEITYGVIPSGLYVLHSCDNRQCVNPKHLFLGTHQDNMDDMARKGRKVVFFGNEHWSRIHPENRVRGEAIGNHKLTENDVLLIRSRYALGEKQRQLAAEFGVTVHAIAAVVQRKTWKHI